MPRGFELDIDVEALARQGKGILAIGWVANALFAATAVPVAAGIDDLLGLAIVVALGLFLFSVGVFVYAFLLALARNREGDDIAVSNLFFLQGSAPRPIRIKFLVVFLACLAVAAGTAAWEPFGVLVPMLPIALAGVWAGRHGVFMPRRAAQPRRRA